MTDLPTILLVASGLAIALLGVAVLRLRARARRLETLFEDSSAKLERLQVQFQRFVPAEVVDRLTGDGDVTAPARRQVTMLFADLRGFTALCDRLDPAVTLAMLNGYFQCMSEAIARHHGHVTEFMGDGLLALFGALEPNPWQARDSVLAALDMRAELARYNQELSAQSLPELRFGIGIHGGEVIAGVMGAAELNKFGVTGDAINVASRVEGLTKEHKVDLLITAEIRAALDERFQVRAMPAVQVKGKAEPLVTYYVEGLGQETPTGIQPTPARRG